MLSLLAVLVLLVATRARLSQYDHVMAPTGIMAKATKLAECRFEGPLHLTPPTTPVSEPAFQACDDIVLAQATMDRHLAAAAFSPLRN